MIRRNQTIIIRPYTFLRVPGRTSWFGISFDTPRMRTELTPQGLRYLSSKRIGWYETRTEAIERACDVIPEPTHDKEES